MKTLKVNFTIPEDIVLALNNRIEMRKRSAFVATAVREKLKEIEKEDMTKLLVEGYQALAEEHASRESDWENVSLESWPD